MRPGTHEAAATADVADVETIRQAFPALRRVHEGRPVAYFDGPGGTQVPQAVVDAVADYLLNHNANTHWEYPTSYETDAALLAARAALADYLGGQPEEIVFGNNMTTLTFHLSRALGRAWGPGDEIVVTELDHHANVDTWRALARDRGVTIRRVPMRPETGTLDEADLATAITPRTKLLAIGAASNALGTINDVRAAADRAHAVGALVFVDAVHYAAHEMVDVAAFDCDFLACSAYKFYGPHVGVLWGRRALLDGLDVPRLVPADEAAPERLETGTLNHEGIVGAAAAVDFLASLGIAGVGRRERVRHVITELHARGQALFERLWDGLGAIPGVTRYGPPPPAPRTSTVSFVVANHDANSVARALAHEAVFVSSGDFYATTVAQRLGHGEDGLVRAGCAAYTTADEVDRLLEAVRAVAT
jgi:cysteine desulfurase family protein (TIGR01976 family)